MAKAKYQIKHIYDETLGENVWVSYGTPREYFIKQINKELNIELIIDARINGKAFQLDTGKAIIYAVWTRRKSPSVLAHEAFHTVNWILGEKGMSLSDSSEEIYCYLLERIMREALC